MPKTATYGLSTATPFFDGLGDYFRLTFNLLSIDFRPTERRRYARTAS
jgi:hypothetical protein